MDAERDSSETPKEGRRVLRWRRYVERTKLALARESARIGGQDVAESLARLRALAASSECPREQRLNATELLKHHRAVAGMVDEDEAASLHVVHGIDPAVRDLIVRGLSSDGTRRAVEDQIAELERGVEPEA